MNLVGSLLVLVGALFCFLGALGVWRMPDVYNRIQTGTKAVTMGVLATLLGVGLLQPAWWPKLVAIGGLLLLTNPVSSSVIARALFRAGVRPWQRDD
jgi:multicomponent Na+:H+ antiporter subunit G